MRQKSQRALDEKIDSLRERKPREKLFEVGEIEQRLERLEQQKKAAVREKIVKRLTKNSKEYIKSLLVSYIRKYGQIGALQLKDMVVIEQGLCSKSSFYRILEEMELLEEIEVARRGKENFYLYKAVKQL